MQNLNKILLFQLKSKTQPFFVLCWDLQPKNGLFLPNIEFILGIVSELYLNNDFDGGQERTRRT